MTTPLETDMTIKISTNERTIRQHGRTWTLRARTDGIQRSLSILDGDGGYIGCVWTARWNPGVYANLDGAPVEQLIRGTVNESVTKDRLFTDLRNQLIARYVRAAAEAAG
jgi:hypothetical protein